MGRGVKPNLKIAERLFEAAFRRDAEWATGIGNVYERELKDFAKASHWFERGAALGVKNAVIFLDLFTNRRRSIRFPTSRVLGACANRMTVSAPSALGTCTYMAEMSNGTQPKPINGFKRRSAKATPGCWPI